MPSLIVAFVSYFNKKLFINYCQYLFSFFSFFEILSMFHLIDGGAAAATATAQRKSNKFMPKIFNEKI